MAFMNKEMAKRYSVYLLRWQCSTVILAPVIYLLGSRSAWLAAITANLIGGLVFFWVDKFIFKLRYPVWTVSYGRCDSCGAERRLYRRMLDHRDKYNAEKKEPVYLCEKCSVEKTEKSGKQ